MNLLNSRQFKKAGELLVDSLSTFTASELIEYNDFVGLAIVVNVLVLKRVDLKKQVRLLLSASSFTYRIILTGVAHETLADYRFTRSHRCYPGDSPSGYIPHVHL